MNRTRCLSIGLALIHCLIASASTIPIELDITDGENTQQLVIDVPLIEVSPDGQYFDMAGTASSPSWRVDWHVSGSNVLVGNSLNEPPQSSLSFAYYVSNLSDDDRSYVLALRRPVPVLPDEMEYQGTLSPSVTDTNGDGAVLTGNPAASSTFYLSQVDGVPFVGLLGALSSTEAGPFATNGFTTPGGSPFNFPCYPCDLWLPGPATTSDLGIELAFSITSHDRGEFDGSFSGQGVPEPSTIEISCLLFFALGYWRHQADKNRRRSHIDIAHFANMEYMQ